MRNRLYWVMQTGASREDVGLSANPGDLNLAGIPMSITSGFGAHINIT